jgi:hypothetical protein
VADRDTAGGKLAAVGRVCGLRSPVNVDVPSQIRDQAYAESPPVL